MTNRYSIIDFGAKVDAKINTRAIQETLDICAKHGGGVVEVPAGTFVTGTLQLHSHITLHLAPGAVLKGSGNMKDYRSFGYTHNEFGDVLSLLYAQDCHNISFSGTGTIDFHGSAFFDFTKVHDNVVAIENLTEEQQQEFAVAYTERPNQLMFFHNCTHMTMRDVSFVDAPCWGIVYSNCSDIQIDGITIKNSLRIPNSDGIHLSGCSNVMISNCNIVSGDDCIAITGIDGWDVVSERILINNCLLCSTSAGVRVGYWHSKVKHIRISHCIMYNCTRGICIMSCGKGFVKDIYVSDVSIHTTSRVGSWWGIGEPVYILGMPHTVQNQREYVDDGCIEPVNIRNVVLRNIDMQAVNPIVMVGNGNIEDITCSDTTYTALEHKNEQFFGDALDLQPSVEVRYKHKKTYWGYFEGVKGLDVAGVQVKPSALKKGMPLECLVLS